MSDLPSATGAKTLVFAAVSSALFFVGLLAVALMLAALFVFIISLGLFVPLFRTGIPAHTIPLAIGVGFGSAVLAVVCELLAIGLGVAGRKHFCGKVGMIGGIVVLACPMLIWLATLVHR
jgi:hypothetical protein